MPQAPPEGGACDLRLGCLVEHQSGLIRCGEGAVGAGELAQESQGDGFGGCFGANVASLAVDG